MERALRDRLRAALIAGVGTANGRPAVDWNERQSDDKDAFNAIVLTTVSPGRIYYQDGVDGLTRPRIRAEVFGLAPMSTKETKAALIAEMEREIAFGGTQFNRSELAFERDADPEDLPGGMKVFRTILDFFVPNSPYRRN